jgi:plastocyanin
MKTHAAGMVSKVAAAAMCLVVTSMPASASSEVSETIVVKDFMFQPMSSTIKAGTKVTWLNKDDEPHTVVGDNGLFRSAAMDTNESFSFEFDQPGTYHFVCSIHPSMVGTIVVQ